MNIKLNDNLFYVIFQTRWGFFGLTGSKNALIRAVLPSPNRKNVEKLLLKGLKNACLDINFFKYLQQRIRTFFEGCCVDFSDVPVQVDHFNHFTKEVLAACRNVTFAERITYRQLAEKIGCPDAARAVGTALSKNPLPLIIPCHRIIRSDGSISGFSAPGGSKLKSKLIQHEFAVKRRGTIRYA